MIKNSYCITLTHESGRQVILYTGSDYECEMMMRWYNNHREFFNGEFTIDVYDH